MVDTSKQLHEEILDINEVFDNIVLSEQKISDQGFDEGFKKGTVEGQCEGFHLGFHRGAEIGSEIGYYKGVVEALLKTCSVDLTPHKHLEALNRVNKLIDLFPIDNNETSDIVVLRDNIRSQYKRLCSLLKIDPSLPENNELSF